MHAHIAATHAVHNTTVQYPHPGEGQYGNKAYDSKNNQEDIEYRPFIH